MKGLVIASRGPKNHRGSIGSLRSLWIRDFSLRPTGAGDSIWPVSQDCAALVLGYFPAAPPGLARFVSLGSNSIGELLLTNELVEI